MCLRFLCILPQQPPHHTPPVLGLSFYHNNHGTSTAPRQSPVNTGRQKFTFQMWKLFRNVNNEVYAVLYGCWRQTRSAVYPFLEASGPWWSYSLSLVVVDTQTREDPPSATCVAPPDQWPQHTFLSAFPIFACYYKFSLFFLPTFLNYLFISRQSCSHYLLYTEELNVLASFIGHLYVPRGVLASECT